MIYLKELTINDVSKSYVKWMGDYEIHKYTSQKYEKSTFKSVAKYVREKKNLKNEFLYGIFLRKNKKHIGNIKLGPINCVHKNANISYFIGDKNYWGKGYATLAIEEVIKIAKKKGLKKLQAYYHELNSASEKVLKKNKFKFKSTQKSNTIFYDYLTDLVL